MHPFLILILAMGVVLSGVLILRLHAFLALVLGALLVAVLTPAHALYDEALRDHAAAISEIGHDGQIYSLDRSPGRAGNYYLYRYDPAARRLKELGVVAWRPDAGAELQARQVDAASPIVPQAGDLLASDEARDAAAQAAEASAAERLAAGFGTTCGKIGLLIAMATIIGKCLLESGSAARIVDSVQKLFGERLTPVAMAVSSFIIAIPVFFDTVFYLMIPIAVEMARKSGKNYLLYVLAIVAGGSIAHSLVPPTPGPLFVASELDVSVGMMILGGGVVAATGVVCVFPYLLWANRRWPMTPRELPAETSLPAIRRDLPPLWAAALPIGLPVILIGAATVIEAAGRPAAAIPAIQFLGDKNVALMLAAAIALVTLWRHDPANRAGRRAAIQEALSTAGVIILITAAGGAFGSVLRTTGIAAALQNVVPAAESGVSLLLIAFFLTSLIRVAQGSATVAMIAAAGIVGPLATTLDLPYHPLYLALAIGSGSKPLPWMNDSGFWVIGKMSGMSEAETLKTFTVVLTIMGVACLAATIVGAILFPLV